MPFHDPNLPLLHICCVTVQISVFLSLVYNPHYIQPVSHDECSAPVHPLIALFVTVVARWLICTTVLHTPYFQ